MEAHLFQTIAYSPGPAIGALSLSCSSSGARVIWQTSENSSPVKYSERDIRKLEGLELQHKSYRLGKHHHRHCPKRIVKLWLEPRPAHAAELARVISRCVKDTTFLSSFRLSMSTPHGPVHSRVVVTIASPPSRSSQKSPSYVRKSARPGPSPSALRYET